MGRSSGDPGLFRAITKFLRRSGDGDARDVSPRMGPFDRLRGRSLPEPNARVGDLRGYRLPDVNSTELSRRKAEDLRRLSDQELLNAVFNPRDGWHIQAYRHGGWVTQGNHRTAELLRRADDPGSAITEDTPVYVDLLPD